MCTVISRWMSAIGHGVCAYSPCAFCVANGSPSNDIPWINDHHDLRLCIKLLPEGANTKAAFACTSADPGITARVKSFRATRPEVTWLVCLVCEAVLDRKKAAALSVRLFQLQTADEIVHHMHAK